MHNIQYIHIFQKVNTLSTINDIFRNMYYIEEEKRGQGAVENHIVPGVYEVEIEAKTLINISLLFVH